MVTHPRSAGFEPRASTFRGACPLRHGAEGARLRSRRAWQEASPIGPHSRGGGVSLPCRQRRTLKCFRTTDFSGSGTVLDNEDLGETTVGILRDMFGCNIKVLATAEDSPATHANPGRDAEGAAACARRRPLRLPPPSRRADYTSTCDLPRQAGAHMPRHGRAQLLQLRKRPRRHRV